MILLDTNVVSELMRKSPEPVVRDWFNGQPITELSVSTFVVAEITRELSRLPAGRRRDLLTTSFTGFMAEAFAGRIIPFDEVAANAYGPLAARRQQEGFNTDAVDLMIAAIAQSSNAVVATRNVRDFDGCGITVINPWAVG